MIFLLLSILSSSIILLLFRWMSGAAVNTRIAIGINYLVAGLTGLLFFDHESSLWHEPWFWPAAIEGIFFYVVFRLIAKTTQVSGVAIASIATKMSVVIPILIGLLALGEQFSMLKVAGIVLGLLAVILSTGGGSNKSVNWFWPIIAFICTGLIDSSLKLFQVWTVSEPEFPSLITVIFSFAFISSMIHHFSFQQRTVSSQDVYGGLALGLVNFGSLLFILLALDEPGWDSSTIFPINNVGVVTVSSVAAVILFKERMEVRTLIGIFIAICSILLLFLSS